jgi:hypothetical protein
MPINIGKGTGLQVIERSSTAAERGGEGIAFKICSRAKPFPKAFNAVKDLGWKWAANLG